MDVDRASKVGLRHMYGAALHTHVDVIIFSGLEGTSKGALDEREEEDVGPPRIRFVKNHHLGLVLHVASSLPDPEGGPPDLESENAHEADPRELAEGHHVAALGAAGGLEPDEAPVGADGLLGRDEEGWVEHNVGGDVEEE